MFDGTQLFPLLMSIFFITICIVLVELLLSWKSIGNDSVSLQWKLGIWMTVGSFVIGALLVHQQLQQREHKDVEAVEMSSCVLPTVG